MATSGSYDYNATAIKIIREAMRIAGALDPHESLEAADSNTCLETLNMMVKHWQESEGIGLWKSVNAVVFQEYGEKEYLLGPSGDYASASYVKTEIATAASASDGTVTVDDDDGFSDGDYIGIELDDGTLQWTTVNGAPVANVITLDDVLTDSAAVDNHVYGYTNILQRPVEITEARLRSASGYERPIKIISRDEYMRLPNKDQKGTVTQVYYEPLLTNGKLYTWLAGNDMQEVIKISARIPIEDFDATTNDPDFPQGWLLPLAWNLAVLIDPKYAKRMTTEDKVIAENMKMSTFGGDTEHESVFLSME